MRDLDHPLSPPCAPQQQKAAARAARCAASCAPPPQQRQTPSPLACLAALALLAIRSAHRPCLPRYIVHAWLAGRHARGRSVLLGHRVFRDLPLSSISVLGGCVDLHMILVNALVCFETFLSGAVRCIRSGGVAMAAMATLPTQHSQHCHWCSALCLGLALRAAGVASTAENTQPST